MMSKKRSLLTDSMNSNTNHGFTTSSNFSNPTPSPYQRPFRSSIPSTPANSFSNSTQLTSTYSSPSPSPSSSSSSSLSSSFYSYSYYPTIPLADWQRYYYSMNQTTSNLNLHSIPQVHPELRVSFEEGWGGDIQSFKEPSTTIQAPPLIGWKSPWAPWLPYFNPSTTWSQEFNEHVRDYVANHYPSPSTSSSCVPSTSMITTASTASTNDDKMSP